MRRAWRVVRRTGLAFYDDQMTHHAAALTYYALMSLFPAVLLGLSLLGLVGQYPETYNDLIRYLERVAPPATIDALDDSLRDAVRSKGTAATALLVGVVAALWGTTGVLEAARRALNVVFRVEAGRGFVHRKAIDIASTFVLMALVLVTLILVFVGGEFADDLFDEIGFGADAAKVWSLARWPAAVLAAMVAFSWVYYITPDVEERSFRWVTPGAVVAVALWLLTSYAFSSYIANFAEVSALYGAFTAVILLLAWMWLTSAAMLFGAELNAEIQRERGSA